MCTKLRVHLAHVAPVTCALGAAAAWGADAAAAAAAWAAAAGVEAAVAAAHHQASCFRCFFFSHLIAKCR